MSLKSLMAKYGKLAFMCHLGISACSFGTCYFFVKNGIDLGKYIE